MLKSIHKLTFSPSSSPWVILDFDELIQDDLKIAPSSTVEVIPLVDSTSPFIRDGKNTSYTFGFTVQRSLSTTALALAAMMDGLVTLASKGVAPLKVEVKGVTGHYWTFAQAKVTANTPSARRRGLGLYLVEFNVVAAGLTYT